jgi:hexosaminidase
VIHLHLTDDQGWRLESKLYPKLNTVSAYRSGTQTGPYPLQHFDTFSYRGNYSQEFLEEFVVYCQHWYNITVIPEIEMPGHALAALAAYPELSCTGGPFETAKGWGVFDDVFCAGNEATFTFLQNILQETMRTFPNSPYIHIGGDECPKERWKHCPKCQQRMKDHGLKDEHELQSYFIQRIEKYLQDSGWYVDATGDTIQGRNIIGWDEILEGGLAPKATVMSWRGVDGGIAAAQQHHNAIMTPGKPLYWDHYQSKDSTEPHAIGGFNPIENVYAYEPIPAALPDSLHRYILGAQANVWTEYILSPDHVEYMVMPRMPALAEVLWSNPQQKDFTDFKRRLTEHRKNWNNINYCPTVFGEPATFFRNGNKK